MGSSPSESNNLEWTTTKMTCEPASCISTCDQAAPSIQHEGTFSFSQEPGGAQTLILVEDKTPKEEYGCVEKKQVATLTEVKQ